MSTRLNRWFQKRASHATHSDARLGPRLPGPEHQESIINYIQHVENANFGINYGHQSMGSSSATTPAIHNLNSLPVHPDVSGRRSEYLENSRDEETLFVYTWMETSPDLVLCIHASAGTGKSTFAHHLGEDLRSKNRLAAALFMTFMPDSWGPETIVRLIAGELGRIHVGAIPSILEAVENYSGSSLSMQQLLDHYICRPIETLGLQHPLVVIIDAFDEWETHLIFLKQAIHLESFRHLVKFVILGRTEQQARDFPGVSISTYPLPPASQDVLVKFFNVRLAGVEWGDGEKLGQRQVEQLADKANGVFVWAWTVCSTIMDDFVDAPPSKILDQMLTAQRTVGDTELLAQLYHGAIVRSFPKESEREYVLKYLRAIFVLEEPLPLADFSVISLMEQRTVQRIRRGLRALQIREPPDSEVVVYPAAALFHLSVTEFFLSTLTPPKFALPISLYHANTGLAGACLGLLPRLFPTATSDPALQRYRALLEYVRDYWPIHFTHGAPPVAPDSGLDLGQDSLCLSLQDLPLSTLRGWAKAILPFNTEDKDSPLHDVHLVLRHVAERVDEGSWGVSVLSIACLEVAVRLRPDVATVWSDLGWASSRTAEVTYSPRHCERAILIHRHAVHLAAAINGGEREAAMKRGLACALLTSRSYERQFESSNAIEESISLLKELLQQDLEKDFRITLMDDLAKCFNHRYQASNSMEDLVEHIILSRKALELCPRGRWNQSTLLNRLAMSLGDRFKATGDLDALDESIHLHRQALVLRPEGHVSRYESLNNLAFSLHGQYSAKGDIGALEEAVQLHREALTLLPKGHASYYMVLSNLGNSLGSLFQATGSVDTLMRCIQHHRQALQLCCDGNPRRPESLHNLANGLAAQFKVTGAIAILHESILRYREALELLPEGCVACMLSLQGLATTLHWLFLATRAVAALDESIRRSREAVELRPESHPLHYKSLWNLATGLLSRYKHQNSIQDLHEAISWTDQALVLCPEHRTKDRADIQQSASMLADALARHLDAEAGGHPGSGR